jgi:phosphonate transport system substrate-binding protein
MIRGLAVLTLVLSSSSACRARAPEPTPDAVPPPRAAQELRLELPLTDVPERLRLMITPVFAPAELALAYAPLAAYLGEALGTDVELVTPPDYYGALDSVLRGEADIAQLTPLTYVLAKQQLPSLELLVTNISEGSSTYSGYLLARAGSSMRTVAELRGKVLGFISPESTSGYLYPYAFFLEQGIDPEQHFKRIVMLGHHDAALDALVLGEIDVVATFSGALLHAEGDGLRTEGLEIIAKTGRIPYDAWAVRGELPLGVKQRLEKTLLELSTRTAIGRRVLGPLRSTNGFAEASDAMYDDVRRVKKLVDQATE